MTKPAEFKSRLLGRLYYNGEPAVLDMERMTRVYYGAGFKNQPKATQLKQMKSIAQQFKDNLQAMKKEKYRDVRYYALNLHSYFLRGTVEFRHHGQSVDFYELSNWGMVCQQLVTSAYRTTQRQIEALPRNSWRSLLALMPERLHQYIINAWHRNNSIIAQRPDFQQEWEAQWGKKFKPRTDWKVA